MQNVKPTPGAGGDHYIPYEEREKGAGIHRLLHPRPVGRGP